MAPHYFFKPCNNLQRGLYCLRDTCKGTGVQGSQSHLLKITVPGSHRSHADKPLRLLKH